MAHPGGRRDFRLPEADPPGTSRLFIAVPLPDDVRDAVGSLMERVAGEPIGERGPGRLRWVRVDGLHLTLRFLGATPDARRGELAQLIARAAEDVAPFDVELRGGGAFPTVERPRVLWLSIVEGAAELGRLVERLDADLVPLGWAPEERGFRPHLTLARSDGVPGAREAAHRLVELAHDEEFSWRADRITLYRSQLSRGGARYEALEESALGAPG